MQKEAMLLYEQQALPQPPNPVIGDVSNQAVQKPAQNEIEGHALDPAIPQLLPLEGALQPHNPPQENNQQQAPIDFDLQAMLQEFENDTDQDQVLLAATQEMQNTNFKTTTVMKKTSSPKITPQEIFQGCTFSNVGAINIHIHKH